MISGNVTDEEAEMILDMLLYREYDEEDGEFENRSANYHVLDTPQTTGIHTDVIELIPWTGFEMDETGELPKEVTFWDKIGDVIVRILGGFTEFVVSAAETLAQGVIAVAGFIGDIVDIVADWGLSVIGAIGDAFSAVRDAVSEVAEMVKSLVDWVLEAVKNVVTEIIQPYIESIKEAIDEYVMSLGQALEDAFLEYEDTGDISEDTGQRVNELMVGSLYKILLGVSAAIVGATAALTYSIPIAGVIAGAIGSIAMTVILINIIGEADFDGYPSISWGTPSDMTAGGIFELARDYIEENVNSPSNLEGMLETFSVIFGHFAIGLNAQIAASAGDPSGWIAIITSICVSVLTILMINRILDLQGTGEVSDLFLDMLAIAGIAYSFLVGIVSSLAVIRVKATSPGSVGYGYTAIGFAFAGVAVGIIVLAAG